jgi:diadenylate cyclase
MMESILSQFSSLAAQFGKLNNRLLLNIIDIALISFVLYRLLLIIKGTRAMQVLRGLVAVVVVFFIADQMGLSAMSWILRNAMALGVIALFIVFQPELRRALAQIGGTSVLSNQPPGGGELVIGEVVRAVARLSAKRSGALIALERDTGLRDYVETGIEMGAKVSAELIITIFLSHGTPLNDGAVIISRDRILAASCFLPLARYTKLGVELGSRHRAGVGLSEESDAVVIIVSEETGNVSLAINGELETVSASQFDQEEFRRLISSLWGVREAKRGFASYFRRGVGN